MQTLVFVGATMSAVKVTPVPAVDLTRYMGHWYEIARYPNRFQTRCAGNVTAEYTMRTDGHIAVVNRCARTDGAEEAVESVARLADPTHSTSKLQVRFAPALLSWLPQVWGDYWIIGLASDYRYAVVGDPSRQYLWILARGPVLPDADYDAAVAIAVANGYDPARLQRTLQIERRRATATRDAAVDALIGGDRRKPR
jgi:apolipoprotein D and lipocalin family protein